MSAGGFAIAIGGGRADVLTPALLLNLDTLRANIETMADWSRGRVNVRPHAKIHKCVEIARLQIEAGACGLTVATIWEALALAQTGTPSILIANELLDARKLDLLAAAAREQSFIIAIDSVEAAEALSAAALGAGSVIGALVDIDVGMGRCGVRTVQDALRVAAAIDGLAGIELRGAMGYEGHVVTEPDRELRARMAGEAMDMLIDYVGQLRAAGFEIEIVSAGGTTTFDMTGAHDGVTEIQTGSYAVMDAMYAPLAPVFRPAITILARCISRKNGTAVLDAGTKVVAIDYTPPKVPAGYGSIRAVHEEHMLLDVTDSDGPALDEPVEVVVGYCGGTISLHDVFHVVQGETVVDVWPILARGPGRGVL